MLSVNKPTTVGSIVTRPSDNRMAVVNILTKDDPQPCTHQHLYILSYGKINNGDWYMNGRYIYQADRFYERADNDIKIIASTNTLIINDDGSNMGITIPKLPNSFIKYFVDEHNKGNTVTETMVEYRHLGGTGSGYVPKINEKDNTITIQHV